MQPWAMWGGAKWAWQPIEGGSSGLLDGVGEQRTQGEIGG